MSEDGWITGPALEIASQLAAFRPGDEVVIENLGRSPGVTAFDEATTGVVTDTHCSDNKKGFGCSPNLLAVRYYVHFPKYARSWWVWKDSKVVAWKPKTAG